MTERLWQEVKPLYMALHTYTRTKLNQKYGNAVQPATGPIRADLLGNMWAQEWGNIYDAGRAARAPATSAMTSPTLIEQKKMTPVDMVRSARASSPRSASRRFRRPSTARSMFTKPAGPRSRVPRLGVGHRQ